MIVKKLAAPLINSKILQQAEHCCIATAAITEPAFDFIKNRLPPKCKIEIVTGLDALSSPGVLRRIWRHYQDRITLNIYTKNFFHANVYIFDLPYRKAVAFVGSGHLTLPGLKDNEEIFWKIMDPKDIETLKSWFTGYYEFSVPLTETLLQEYELIFPEMKQREIESRYEKQDLIALSAQGLQWDSIKFKNQYFNKEDYLTLGNRKAALNTEEVIAERTSVQNKLIHLHGLLQQHVLRLGFDAQPDPHHHVSSIHSDSHHHGKVRTMWIGYSAPETESMQLTVKFIIRQYEVGVRLIVQEMNHNSIRSYLGDQMQDLAFRNRFLLGLTSLDPDYWIEIGGEKRGVASFQNEDSLWEFTRMDQGLDKGFVIGKNYSPGNGGISVENIAPTIMKEFDRLMLMYGQIAGKSAHQ